MSINCAIEPFQLTSLFVPVNNLFWFPEFFQDINSVAATFVDEDTTAFQKLVQGQAPNGADYVEVNAGVFVDKGGTNKIGW